MNLCVIILTRDEEKNLPHALASLSGLGARVVVVDSGSVDATCKIAREAGCELVAHPFETHARQLNWAIGNVTASCDWVLRLDADERLTDELRTELLQKLPSLPEEVTGLMVKRRVYFWGRWIRHGGYYPTWLLRIWRNGAAHCEDRAMDEHMRVSRGRIERLEHDIIDENRKGIAFWIDKHNRFSDSEVVALQRTEASLVSRDAGAPTARKRFLKNTIYGRSPMFVRALLYWLFRYFVLLGIL